MRIFAVSQDTEKCDLAHMPDPVEFGGYEKGEIIPNLLPGSGCDLDHKPL
jgi:hypothetical protein